MRVSRYGRWANQECFHLSTSIIQMVVAFFVAVFMDESIRLLMGFATPREAELHKMISSASLV